MLNITQHKAERLARTSHARYTYLDSTKYYDRKTGNYLTGKRLHRMKRTANFLSNLAMSQSEKNFVRNVLGARVLARQERLERGLPVRSKL